MWVESTTVGTEKAFALWPAAYKVVDPVMGDNGKAYSTVTPALVERIRSRRTDRGCKGSFWVQRVFANRKTSLLKKHYGTVYHKLLHKKSVYQILLRK